MDVGNGTPFTAQNLIALQGFNGKLNIGGVVDPVFSGGGINPPVGGDVVVTRPIILGPNGELTIAALGDLTIAETISANQINLIAVGDDGTAIGAPGNIGACGGCILDVGSTDVLLANSAVLVANNTIGLDNNNFNVDIQNTLDFASGQDDISDTLNDQFVTFSGTNLGPESSAIVNAYQLAFTSLGFAVFQTDLSAVFNALGLGTGLEVRDESLFSTDASAFGTDFLIFDPGEGTKTPFDQDSALPSQLDYPADAEDDAAWDEFYAGEVLSFVKGRWFTDETLIDYVQGNFALDLSSEGDATFEQIVALRDHLLTKTERTSEEIELLRILESFVGEYPQVVAHFKSDRVKVQQAAAAHDLEPLNLPDSEFLDDPPALPGDEDAGGLPALPQTPSAGLDEGLSPFASLRIVGQTWVQGGLGIEDSWSTRLPSAFPAELPAKLIRGDG